MLHRLSDAWFFNNHESCAFYLSTNTFRNPLFEVSDLEQPIVAEMGGDSGDGGGDGSLATDDHAAADHRQRRPTELENKTSSLGVDHLKTLGIHATNCSTDAPTAPSLSSSFRKQARRRCADFCDNLLFSLRSKMFVLELNFKRKICNLKNFANHRLARFSFAPTAAKTTLDQRSTAASSDHNYRQPTRLSTQSASTNAGWWPGCKQRSMPKSQTLNSLLACSELERAIYGPGAARASTCKANLDSDFWNKVRAPDSREALGAQQEKILSRLERVVRAKRTMKGLQTQQQNKPPGQTPPIEPPLNVAGRPARAFGTVAALQSSLVSPTFSQPGCLGDKHLAPAQALNDRTTKQRPFDWALANETKCQLEDGANLAQSQQRMCVVCYANTPNIVTFPCEHHEICSDCFIELIYMAVKRRQYPLRCVLCRRKVEKIRCSGDLAWPIPETSVQQTA